MDLRGMVEQARPDLLVEQVLRDFQGEVAVAVLRQPTFETQDARWEGWIDSMPARYTSATYGV